MIKRIIASLLIIVLLMCAFAPFAFARAGGGGGGGGGSSGRTLHRFARRVDIFNVLDDPFPIGAYYLIYFVYLLFYFGALIAFPFFAIKMIIKRKRKTKSNKQLLLLLSENDLSWNPKKLQNHIEDTYFQIQKAWSDNQLFRVKHLMDDKLYEEFLELLKQNERMGKRNVLSKIRLLRADPIQVFDHSDDSRDHIWYYIKGKMVDKTVYIDSPNNDAEISNLFFSSKTTSRFVEYWKFVKRNDTWVLSKIAQKDELPEFKY